MLINKKPIINAKILFLIISLSTIFLSPLVFAENVNDFNAITINYSFTQPVIKKVDVGKDIYDSIIMPSAPSGGSVGEPCLPVKGAYILLPQKTRIDKISVSTDNKISLGFNFKVIPVSQSVPLSQISLASIPTPNEKIYENSEIFPEEVFTEIGTYSFRGYQILVLMLHPVQYVPTTGELVYYENIKISVETVKNEHMNTLFRGLDQDISELRTMIDNHEVITTYSNKLSSSELLDGYELLILTTDELKDVFEDLQNVHNAEKVDTVIKTLTDVGSSDPEDIRDFIRDEYVNNNIEYLLLGGDDNIIPARQLCVISEIGAPPDDMPSDLYYGCLDGTYNYDDDSSWGEPTDGEGGGDVDLVAEVYVGRACVGNREEAGFFVNKTISYLITDPDDDYLDEALMVGEYIGIWGEGRWGGDHMDELIDGCNNHGYKTVGIPSDEYNISTLYDRDWRWPYWPKEELIMRINNGTHIINHLGHGHPFHVMKLDEPVLYDFLFDEVIGVCHDILENLTNNKYFFVYSQACYSGAFDNRSFNFSGYPSMLPYDCIAEYFTVKSENAAFAVIMNARYGYGSLDTTTDGPSQRYHREYWDAVFGEGKTQISKANQDSKEDNLYRISEDYMRWCYYELNLFGDPTIDFLKYINNSSPITPLIFGEINGKTEIDYDYTFVTTDPNGNDLYYYIDWDDGTVKEWIGPYKSGEEVTVSHTWTTRGTYSIKAKAKDIFGAESNWTTFEVTIPRKKAFFIIQPILLWLFEKFTILRHIIEL